ncbi:MAG TPA: AAA family ATPase, partial [Chromatiaceae bacterium]|nr:AAA family ATPase [Chromatiaceae bacterium]
MQSAFALLHRFISSQIIGQKYLVDRLLVALLADGHLLVEGAPGLAKTRAIKTLSEGLDGSFHRVQFTPDLLPSDITGTEVYHAQDGTFNFQRGPLFHNLVLADEINRAPAKVQSALLEAMGERQITVGSETYPLPDLFLVMATQNPIEQEGTYPLPEAQLDRFLLHVRIGYPDADSERQILALAQTEARGQNTESSTPASVLTQADIFAARQAVLDVHCSEPLQAYLLELVLATRQAAA